jgi:Zn-dependent M28 family amino/carboxypeptidase
MKRLICRVAPLGALILLLTLVGCAGDPVGRDQSLASATDRLRTDVVALSDTIGNRSVGAYTHLGQAADYIEGQFRAQGYSPARQTFTARGKPVSNLVARRPGRDPSRPGVLIGAHYDTYFAPGAEDNASGVAAVLELARRFSTRTPPGPVRFVAFVNEEDPWWGTDKMGSLVCARRARAADEDLLVMLNLDMVGYYPGGRHYVRVGANVKSEGIGVEVRQALRQATSFAVRDMPRSDPAIRWSDHWAFWREGYEALYIAGAGWDCDWNIHSPKDTAEKLNYANMAELVQGLDAAIMGLWDGATVRPASVDGLWPMVFGAAS